MRLSSFKPLDSTPCSMSHGQLTVDALLQGFTRDATHSLNLIAMGAGSLTFSSMRLGLRSILGHAVPGTRALSWGLALLGEVSVFRAIMRTSESENSSEFIQSLTDFACLKLTGALSSHWNYLARHSASALGMMMGSSISQSLHLSPIDHQNFSQKFAQAFSSSLALEAGGILSRLGTGGRILQLERNFEVQRQSASASTPHPNRTSLLLNFSHEKVTSDFPREILELQEEARLAIERMEGVSGWERGNAQLQAEIKCAAAFQAFEAVKKNYRDPSHAILLAQCFSRQIELFRHCSDFSKAKNESLHQELLDIPLSEGALEALRISSRAITPSWDNLNQFLACWLLHSLSYGQEIATTYRRLYPNGKLDGRIILNYFFRGCLERNPLWREVQEFNQFFTIDRRVLIHLGNEITEKVGPPICQIFVQEFLAPMAAYLRLAAEDFKKTYGREAIFIEMGAGDGRLSLDLQKRGIAITPTDNRYGAGYGIIYPAEVQNQSAIEAAQKADFILCCWWNNAGATDDAAVARLVAQTPSATSSPPKTFISIHDMENGAHRTHTPSFRRLVEDEANGIFRYDPEGLNLTESGKRLPVSRASLGNFKARSFVSIYRSVLAPPPPVFIASRIEAQSTSPPFALASANLHLRRARHLKKILENAPGDNEEYRDRSHLLVEAYQVAADAFHQANDLRNASLAFFEAAEHLSEAPPLQRESLLDLHRHVEFYRQAIALRLNNDAFSEIGHEVLRHGARLQQREAIIQLYREAYLCRRMVEQLHLEEEIRRFTREYPQLLASPLQIFNLHLRALLGREPLHEEVIQISKDTDLRKRIGETLRETSAALPPLAQIYTREFLDQLQKFIQSSLKDYSTFMDQAPRLGIVVNREEGLLRGLRNRGLDFESIDLSQDNLPQPVRPFVRASELLILVELPHDPARDLEIIQVLARSMRETEVTPKTCLWIYGGEAVPSKDAFHIIRGSFFLKVEHPEALNRLNSQILPVSYRRFTEENYDPAHVILIQEGDHSFATLRRRMKKSKTNT